MYELAISCSIELFILYHISYIRSSFGLSLSHIISILLYIYIYIYICMPYVSSYNITGLDQSEPSLARAKAHSAQVRRSHPEISVPSYIVGSAYDLPFESNSVDGVVISDVLEHLMNLPAVGSEIHRILKPGGVMVFDTINRTPQSFLLTWLVGQEVPITDRVSRIVPRGCQSSVYIYIYNIDRYRYRWI